MTIRYTSLIERRRDASLLFVRALPGFQVVAGSASDLLPRAREAIGHYLDWAAERDLIELSDNVVDLVVGEEAASISPGIGPRFADDLIAPSEEEIEFALAVGRAAVSDLIDAYEESARSASAIAADAVLRHVAERDRWYASRLTGALDHAVAADPLDDLVAAAGAFEDAVDGLAGGSQPDLILRDGEEWTLAKVLRRRTGHLRKHLIDLLPDA
jgi:hypothetical protein